MRHVILLFFFSVFISIVSTCQVKTEMLSNKTIVDLHKADLSNETVISKIEATACKFDLSTTGLIALKKQGVADEVINAMMDKTNSKNISAPAISSDPAKGVKSTSEKRINIELLNYVHTYYNGTVTPLEKALANLKTKTKAFGYGGVNSVLEIEGASSSIKLSPENAAAFVIKTGGETAPDIVLYKLKSTGKKRQAVTGKFRMTGMQGSEGAITVNISILENSVFKISPSQPLEKGEYFFLNRSVSNAGTNSEVFAFSGINSLLLQIIIII